MICGLFGKTRQAWYKQQWTDERDSLRDAIIIKKVREIRSHMPRIGTRKLHYLLTETLQGHNITIGRNKLFDLLADYGMLVRRRKRKRIYTTNSNHPFWKYPNLVRDMQPLRANHLWVSDITYISLEKSFCYLNLITDAYSRKIVGYCLYPSLKKEGTLKALDMALATLPGNLDAPLIHHSDRGLQYCCSDYIKRLNNKQITISMTEKGDPYENAIAERINGILKTEFMLDNSFENIQQATSAVDRSISVYNQMRPHASCDFLTPQQAHVKYGKLASKWRKQPLPI
jgi:putative transposase